MRINEEDIQNHLELPRNCTKTKRKIISNLMVAFSIGAINIIRSFRAGLRYHNKALNCWPKRHS